MNKKRGFIILSILFCFVFLFGCGSKQTALAEEDAGTGASPEQIAVANAKNINAILNGFVSDFGLRETYSSPTPKQINEMRARVASLETIVKNTEFKKNTELVACFEKMKRYAEFIDLSSLRNQKVELFTEKMELAFKETESANFDYAIRLNQESRILLSELEANDMMRQKLNILPVTGRLVSSWKMYIESLRILEQAWMSAKEGKLEEAEEHDANFYTIYNQAIAAGEEDPPEIAGIKVKSWFKENIAPCANII